MIIIRSLIFYPIYYLNNIIQFIAFLPPFLLLGKPSRWKICRFWGRSNIWLHSKIIGTKLEVRGIENIPDGGFIVASKHQSTYETLSLYRCFSDPTYILKKALLYVPFLNIYLIKMGMIGIDRKKGRTILESMTEGVQKALEQNRQVIIFPEGTRRKLDAEPHYKYGIQHLYTKLDTLVVPVALNTGAFWPKGRFLHYPGTVVLEILPPIQPGLSGEEFMHLLSHSIEDRSVKLLEEAANIDQGTPLAIKAMQHLKI